MNIDMWSCILLSQNICIVKNYIYIHNMCYALVHVHDYIHVYINLCACYRCHVLHCYILGQSTCTLVMRNSIWTLEKWIGWELDVVPWCPMLTSTFVWLSLRVFTFPWYPWFLATSGCKWWILLNWFCEYNIIYIFLRDSNSYCSYSPVKCAL